MMILLASLIPWSWAATFTSDCSRLSTFELYTTRFSVSRCGRSWIQYSQQLDAFHREKSSNSESNFDRLIELLAIRLPADTEQGRKAYNHKLWSLARLLHPDTLMMIQWDGRRAAAVLNLIDVNLFAFIERDDGVFTLPLSPEHSYLTFEEPAMDMLKLIYGLLNYLLKEAKSGSELEKAILDSHYERRVS